MKTIHVSAQSGRSKVFVNESLRKLPDYIQERSAIIITDRNVKKHYHSHLKKYPVIEIGLGEKIKTLKTVEMIHKQLLALEVDRSSFIVGVGGGIVCDIAGFVAATYMRGIDFGFVSTSLLSQVDASVGGKNGVNLQRYKNIIGTFKQPEFVICDLEMLRTLPHSELISGFAELIKHAIIGDALLFEYLELNYQEALNLNLSVLEKMVERSVTIKAQVVEQDEKENGVRRILNFGHTFAHGIEQSIGLPHGLAVSVGMVLAAKMSALLAGLDSAEVKRIMQLLQFMQLPVVADVPLKSLLASLRKDKKKQGQEIHFVLLQAMGQPCVKKLTFTQLEQIFHDLH